MRGAVPVETGHRKALARLTSKTSGGNRALAQVPRMRCGQENLEGGSHSTETLKLPVARCYSLEVLKGGKKRARVKVNHMAISHLEAQ